MMGAGDKKRKLILVGITFVLCVTIMMSGTFAWSSISQTALNETMGEMRNPGGRLHDDFNGSNKDIYVENFTNVTDGMPIIVRIRLYEHMEIGADAGTNVPHVSTWKPYIPGGDEQEHYGYWDWTLGGKTVYMPTFDKNKDSQKPDINGTYEGSTPGDGVHFDDYKVYQVGDIKKDGEAVYDADANDKDDGNVTTVREDHVAKETMNGTVISMASWIDLPEEQKLGNFWVYDADGWAYWANPLMPDTATGLLLSQIQLKQAISERWYYGIYVESQMVTADEIVDVTASMNAQKGFYCKHQADADGNCQEQECPSGVAQMLLKRIIDRIPMTSGNIVDSDAADTTALESLEIKDKDLSSTSKSNEDETEKELTDLEEDKENSEDENNSEEVEDDEQNPEDETNTDGNPPDGTGEESGEDSENGQEPEEGEDENTTPEDTSTDNGTGNGTTENTLNGDSTVEGGNGQDDTLKSPEDSGNTNPDNSVTETGTSENGGTAPQEPNTEPTGILEESEDILESQNTSQIF